MHTVFYHCTPIRNIGNIMAEGLLLGFAKNKNHPWVWLTEAPTKALELHLACHHKTIPSCMVWIAVSVPTSKLVRHPHPHCFNDVAFKARRDISASKLHLLVLNFSIVGLGVRP